MSDNHKQGQLWEHIDPDDYQGDSVTIDTLGEGKSVWLQDYEFLESGEFKDNSGQAKEFVIMQCTDLEGNELAIRTGSKFVLKFLHDLNELNVQELLPELIAFERLGKRGWRIVKGSLETSELPF